MSSVTRASRVSELDAEAHIAQYVTVLAHLLLWVVQRACRRFASGNVTKAPNAQTGNAPTRHPRPTFLRSPHVARVVGRHRRPRGKRPGRASGGRPAALHVTDDTGRHLRYTSRAKREADVSLSHRCTMEQPVAPWSTTMRRVLPPRDRR